MNETVKAIVGILDGGRPELQVAAAQILGELRPKDAVAVKSLCVAATRSPVLSRFALEALAHIGTSDAFAYLVQVLVGQDALGDHASHLLTEAGVSAHAAIAQAFAEAPVDRKLKLLSVLARSPSAAAVPPLLAGLAEEATAAAAVALVVQAAPSLSDPVRKALREGLGVVLRAPASPAAAAACLEALAAVDPQGAKSQLLLFAADKQDLAVRKAALHGLRGLSLTLLQAKGLLAALEDPAQQALHEPLRELFAAMPELPDGLQPQFKKLLTARNAEQRLFALRALRSAPPPEALQLAVKWRDHEDARFRAVAEEVLSSSKQAVEPLLKLLLLAREPIEAGNIANLLGKLAPHIPPKTAKAMADKAMKLLPQKPLIADHLTDVAALALGKKIAPFFVERAVRWRKLRRFPEALHVLARLAKLGLLEDEGRYQLAATRLLADAARPESEDAAPGNAAMGFFTALLREGFPLLERVQKDTGLPPEQQLKLASYFAQTVGAERRFGQELLVHLAKRHKGKIADEVRGALRSAGF